MRFRNRNQSSQLPEVNLVPMMDVLMTVLTFFIIISMTMTGQQLLNVSVPRQVQGTDAEDPEAGVQVEPLVIGLDRDSNLVLNNQTASLPQVSQEIRNYLGSNPGGTVILKADREIPYEQVANLLTDLRDVGSDRIFLAVE